MYQYNPNLGVIIPSSLPVVAGFTTIQAGDMRSIQTVTRFFPQADLSPRKIVILEQIHSTNVSTPDLLHLGDVEILDESDGVVTDEKDIALVIRIADCIPILFYDPVAKIIGASHHGWRGSVRNILKNMVNKMKEKGSNPINIRISMGPAIGPCCYNVDMDRYLIFMEAMDQYEKLIFKPHGADFHLNLLRLNYELALAQGIQKNHIDFFPYCTSCDSKRFYSYRRNHKVHPERFGKMMGYIMM